MSQIFWVLRRWAVAPEGVGALVWSPAVAVGMGDGRVWVAPDRQGP